LLSDFIGNAPKLKYPGITAVIVKNNYLCRKFQDLRTGIRTKASLIIFSWLLIMAHNMIPHNHQESDLCILNGHSHTGVIPNDEYHDRGEDHEACRISSILYHQITQDNLFIESSSIDYSSPESRKELIIDNKKHSLYRNSYFASVSLRAPPAA